MDLFDSQDSDSQDNSKINPFVETESGGTDFFYEVTKAKKKYGKAAVHKHINETVPDSKRRLKKILDRIHAKRLESGGVEVSSPTRPETSPAPSRTK